MNSANDHNPVEEVEKHVLNSKATLGTVRLRNAATKEIILVPTPANDPNDPLNWSRRYRVYVGVMACGATFFTLFTGGQIIALILYAEDFLGHVGYGPKLVANVAKVSYFFTTIVLLLGAGNLVIMPLIIKYGRRPVYVATYTLYLVLTIWATVATSYNSELASRILQGFFATSGDCVAPLTLTDIFFLHERGEVLSWYTLAQAVGFGLGLFVDGFILKNNSWRYTGYLNIAVVGAMMLLLIFTMPETLYLRNNAPVTVSPGMLHTEEKQLDIKATAAEVESSSIEHAPSIEHAAIPKKHTYLQRHRLFRGTFTEESYWKLFIRPFFLIILPSPLWSALVFSVNIGFFLVVSSNASLAYSQAYKFQPWQTGLCYLGPVISGILAVVFSGVLADKTADFFTRRNNGIREPEMRLPAIIISIVLGPIGLMLFGVGFKHKLHWIVPTLGVSILNFVLVQSTTVSLAYSIDSYRPIGSEVVAMQLALKAAFAFLLSFYSVTWIAEMGSINAVGSMAGIFEAVMLLAIPLFFYGKRVRLASMRWRVMRFVVWDEDREIGE